MIIFARAFSMVIWSLLEFSGWWRLLQRFQNVDGLYWGFQKYPTNVSEWKWSFLSFQKDGRLYQGLQICARYYLVSIWLLSLQRLSEYWSFSSTYIAFQNIDTYLCFRKLIFTMVLLLYILSFHSISSPGPPLFLSLVFLLYQHFQTSWFTCRFWFIFTNEPQLHW